MNWRKEKRGTDPAPEPTTINESTAPEAPDAELLWINAILWLLSIEVEIVGDIDEDELTPIIALAFPHISHIDMLVIAKALHVLGRRWIMPVTKGDYWDKLGLRNVLQHLFPAGHVMTGWGKNKISNGVVRKRTVDRQLDLLIGNLSITLPVFPSGGRQENPGPATNISSGAFVTAELAWQIHNKDIPLYAMQIENMLPIFQKKVPTDGLHSPDKPAPKRSELWAAVKRKFTGQKQVVKIRVTKLPLPSQTVKTAYDPTLLADELQNAYKKIEANAFKN